MDLVSAKYLLATPKYAMVLLYSRTWEFGAIGVPPFIPSHSTCGAHQYTTHTLLEEKACRILFHKLYNSFRSTFSFFLRWTSIPTFWIPSECQSMSMEWILHTSIHPFLKANTLCLVFRKHNGFQFCNALVHQLSMSVEWYYLCEIVFQHLNGKTYITYISNS